MTKKGGNNLGATVSAHGVEFRVWAPFAKGISIVGDFASDVLPMDSEDNGLWSTFVSNAKAGQSYHYLIETDGPAPLKRNDPRARQLTASDNGSSVIVADDFDWENISFTPIPIEKQIIYEMHIGTFNRPDASTTGTFSDAVEKLDYLQELGINMIELMPVTSMAFASGWGYAPNYIFSIENSYGGRHGMMTFIRECHRRGIGVILDVVYNHFFPESDLWKFDGWSENDRGGIYFYNDDRGDTPWGGRPDYGRTEVREFILDNISMWFTEYKLDGLRVDSTIYMRNTEGHDNDPAHDIPEAWSLLGDITERAREINPHAILIAEDCANNSYITKPKNEGGCGFSAQWELGFPHVLRDALGITNGNNRNLAGIRYELERQYNNDAFQKIVFSDSHDTAANGSTRLNEAATPGNGDSQFARDHILIASGVTMTSSGIPMLLQGQEFMQDGAFNDWQELEWGKTESYQGIVTAHQHLVNLRRNVYGLTAGLIGKNTNVFHQDDNNSVLAYHRWDKGGVGDDTIVIVNFSDNKLSGYMVKFPLKGTWRARFNSSWRGYSSDFNEVTIDNVTIDDQLQATLTLAPRCIIILSQDI